MMKQILKNKRLVLALAATLIFLAAALSYVYHDKCRLLVYVQAEKKDTLALEGKNMAALAFTLPPSEEVYPVSIRLPGKQPEAAALRLGNATGTIAIQGVTLKSLCYSYKWTSRQLLELFPAIEQRRYNFKRKILYLEKGGPDDRLFFSKAFYGGLAEIESKNIYSYGLAILFTLLFFFLVYNLDVSSIKILLTRRLLTTMSGLFLILLFFPLVNGYFSLIPEAKLEENRAMAWKPVFNLGEMFGFPREYTEFYNDHFNFRDNLIFWNNVLKLKMWQISATPQVFIGKEGWLFLGPQDTRSNHVDYYRAIDLFNESELEHWKTILEERRAWLAKRGIYYLFMLAPEKTSIYPEYLPANLHRVHALNRMDQFVRYMKEHSCVPVLDLRKALIKAKPQHMVYSKTDTHWTEFGAYIAYREIMAYIRAHFFKEVQTLPLSRFAIVTKDWSGGDLAAMLGLHKDILREDMVELKANPPLTAQHSRLPGAPGLVRRGFTTCNTAPPFKIFLVHDSFYKRLKPFLAESFAKMFTIWDWDLNFYAETIANDKPNLVIDEMAERFFMERELKNPPEINQ